MSGGHFDVDGQVFRYERHGHGHRPQGAGGDRAARARKERAGPSASEPQAETERERSVSERLQISHAPLTDLYHDVEAEHGNTAIPFTTAEQQDFRSFNRTHLTGEHIGRTFFRTAETSTAPPRRRRDSRPPAGTIVLPADQHYYADGLRLSYHILRERPYMKRMLRTWHPEMLKEPERRLVFQDLAVVSAKCTLAGLVELKNLREEHAVDGSVLLHFRFGDSFINEETEKAKSIISGLVPMDTSTLDDRVEREHTRDKSRSFVSPENEIATATAMTGERVAQHGSRQMSIDMAAAAAAAEQDELAKELGRLGDDELDGFLEDAVVVLMVFQPAGKERGPGGVRLREFHYEQQTACS